jgi:ABC-type uncharacterized transport system substrate-binding protein
VAQCGGQGRAAPETYPAIVAAKQWTSTVPIIMAVSSDPIATGFVASLSRPGGEHHGAHDPFHRTEREAAAVATNALTVENQFSFVNAIAVVIV